MAGLCQAFSPQSKSESEYTVTLDGYGEIRGRGGVEVGARGAPGLGDNALRPPVSVSLSNA
jgi:hypothetical protein